MSGTLSDALEIVLRTDTGRVREHNEDAVFANPHLGFVVLADGMGGYNAGEVASSMATTRLASELESALAARAPHATDGPGGEAFAGQCLRDAVADANAAIFQAAQDEAGYAGMGTTLVAALFFDDRVAVAHVGDSRLYRLRDGTLSLLTHDHSLLQEQIDSGLLSAEEARHSLNRNLVTRALGVDPLVEVDLAEYLVLPDDLYLLCSDGLNDMVPDEEIALALQTLSGHLELAATQLVEMANDQGGRDNVSVILVKVRQAYPAPGTWWQAFKARFG
ncbi:MAG: Stp1/IreP family PP2C-type Ser/Thr phosphatase [Propionivibrio sp.]